MRTFRAATWAIAALAVIVLAAPAAAQSKRPTVALIDFDYGTIDRWWGNEDIGKGIADLIVDGLVEDGSYRVIERKRLDVILAEQNFSNSDRAEPAAAQVAKIGKALGVKYMILGSITKFGIEDKGMKIGAGAWPSPRPTGRRAAAG
jgi:curli biogenesis system outer membrane secretion channel CsgG